ncbi:M15 family metallopeptidase [Bergeyella zoohelcum]|uniref:Peptidase M15C domain-containing protein n=1 Tax=Bergeyella zoohelcum ATCC 43767 TaxID=883096 RepID=K1M2I4_9FLAO|nr:M15 family metallopeptidase [Bergeyella zoohelcum]EKB56583.1 hypothetical protein HMPREF9699_01312 [Bergeyella zoohelcum ATCC 43767]SUV48509.1 Peptidoglycan L-alanyl-D-glutamate endopeptidase CwlK precursor [Bergeyella zoohelcum]
MAVFSKRSLDNLKGVHPNLVKLMQEAIKDSPVDFTITEGVRTAKAQQEYYSWGRTKKNPHTGKMTKVTYADGVKRKSNHQVKADGYGYAVDLYPFIDDKVQTRGDDVIPALKEISDHIKATAKRLGINIVWGGDWRKPYDPPHFQLA